jgi:ribosomal protein S18 acetylase RimI-like enzyme
MTPIEFWHTSRPDVAAAVETLCVAFDTDPVLEWTFPRAIAGRTALVEAFFRITTEMVLEHGGEIGATAGYEAVSVWAPPGEPTMGEARHAEYLAALLAGCGEGGERATTVMRALEAGQPPDLPPHFHVMFAAVRPEHQTRGSASEVSRMLAVAANAAGAGVYAEASNHRSLALWERIGLRRVGPEITLPDGGPSLYPIWGDPGTWSL